MKRKKSKRGYRHTFKFGMSAEDKKGLSICVPMSNAKKSVHLARTLADVLAGKPGIAVACADRICAMRTGAPAFGHPVYFAEFTKTRAYIIDKLDQDGQPKHCLCYAHDDGDFIEEFDKPGGKQRLIKSGDTDRTITLSPPAKRKLQPLGRPEGRYDGSRTKPSSKGADKRAHEAGWIV